MITKLKCVVTLVLLVSVVCIVGCSDRQVYESVISDGSVSISASEDSVEITTVATKATEILEAEISEVSSTAITAAETTTESTAEPTVSEETESYAVIDTDETVDEVEEGYSFAIYQIGTDRDALATSADKLDSVSDVIIKAVPIAQENILITDSSGSVITGYLKTTVQVSEVYKGEVDLSEELVVTEECYFTDSNSVLWTSQGYIPMSIGSEYVLFLSTYSVDSSYAGMYFPVDLEYGKYAVSDDSTYFDVQSEVSIYDLQIGDCTDKERYIEWYSYVANMY
ncbi:MAG: hypothetical protein LUH18_02035 [Oscillospiraceae bacterium]|nr:hypothetical protein [Oscillospiraceae bacterium]